MSTEVIVAMIASCTSLAVSLLSLATSNRSAQGLEKIKFEYERKRERQRESHKYLTRNIESLDLFIQAIQKIKDVLFACLYSTENSLDSESAIIMFSQLKDNYFQLYLSESSMLKNEEREEIHKLKALAHNIEILLREYLTGTMFVDELTIEQKEDLLRNREILTDVQNFLRDVKSSNVQKMLGTYE